MLVCHCKRVRDEVVRSAVKAGARTVEEVGASCRAGTGCGGCQPLIDAIIDEELAAEPGSGSGNVVRLRVAS